MIQAISTGLTLLKNLEKVVIPLDVVIVAVTFVRNLIVTQDFRRAYVSVKDYNDADKVIDLN